MKKFLVTGANGLFGSILVHKLCARYGAANILASDIKNPPKRYACDFTTLDVLNLPKYERIVNENQINYIVHFAKPKSIDHTASKKVTNVAVNNTFDIAHKHHCAIFCKSEMNVFGKAYSQRQAPEDGYRDANSIDGICNAYRELVVEYYYKKCGMDCRCVRYPLIISPIKSTGYNNYVNDMLQKAASHETYKCYVHENTMLPLVHLNDAIEFTFKCITTDRKLLSRCIYNLNGYSTNPKSLVKEIKTHYAQFECAYQPDDRGLAAAMLPSSLQDTSNTELDWGCDASKEIHNAIASAFKVAI